MCFCSWFEADAKLKVWLSHAFNFASAQRASVNSTKKTIDLSWLNWHDFSFFYWQTSGKRPVFDSDNPSEVLTAWFGCEATHFNHYFACILCFYHQRPILRCFVRSLASVSLPAGAVHAYRFSDPPVQRNLFFLVTMPCWFISDKLEVISRSLERLTYTRDPLIFLDGWCSVGFKWG